MSVERGIWIEVWKWTAAESCRRPVAAVEWSLSGATDGGVAGGVNGAGDKCLVGIRSVFLDPVGVPLPSRLMD